MISVIIQARMGSSRLPGKVMKKINGKPLLYYIISQVKAAKKVSKIIVATTQLKEDDQIESYVKSIDIDVFRGNDLDVLDRFYHCARKYDLEKIIRLSADSPFIDFNIIDECISKFEEYEVDYLSNTIKKVNDIWKEDNNGFPLGMAVEVFTIRALEKAWLESTKPSDREHVTEYIFHNHSFFKLHSIKNFEDLSDFRFVVDYPEDFELISKIISGYPINELFTLKNLKDFLDKHSELKMINMVRKRK